MPKLVDDNEPFGANTDSEPASSQSTESLEESSAEVVCLGRNTPPPAESLWTPARMPHGSPPVFGTERYQQPPPNNNEYCGFIKFELVDATNTVSAAPGNIGAAAVPPPTLPHPTTTHSPKERSKPPRKQQRTRTAREDSCCPCSSVSTCSLRKNGCPCAIALKPCRNCDSFG